MKGYGTIPLPAIRGKQGGRTFYVSNLPNLLVRNFLRDVQSAVDISERSQRPLDQKHADDIAHYLKSNVKEYVVGALTFAMKTEGDFTPLPNQNSDGYELGTLQFNLVQEFHSLDGQHRRQAIIRAMEEVESIRDDSTAVIFYVEPDLKRRQQMFSDMNSTPRKVSKSLNIAYNNRDPFARAAKFLADNHPLLSGKVEKLQPRVKADSTDFFSLSSIQDAIKRVVTGSIPKGVVVEDLSDAEIQRKGGEFFDLLLKSRSEFTIASNDPKALQQFREETILFSSTTLRVLAGAVGRANQYYKNQKPAEVHGKLVLALRDIDFSTKSELFVKAGFIAPGSSTPSARNQEIVAAIRAVTEKLKDGTGEEKKNKGSKTTSLQVVH
jgi:DNA sulfur modification protein DndB